MELLKLLSTNEIAAQIISFLLLFFLLRAFAWKRIIKALDDRKEKIYSEFKKIEQAREESLKLKSDYETRIAEIDKESKKIIAEALLEGKKLKEDLRKNAYLESQKIIEQARSEIKYELIAAKEELRDKIVDLSIQAAENLIQNKLSEETDRKLVRDFLNKIDDM